METDNLIQGSNEWRAARVGSVGASQIADVIAKTKSGWGASRANLLAQLTVERLTGLPTEGFTSPAMAWGTEQEPEARIAYEFRTNAIVSELGLVRHPTIIGAHASPDGLVGDDGLLEIKCPQSATHIDTLLTGSIPGKYETQMLWQMACTGREWCDFASYDPRMPVEMQLFVKRFTRDAERIAELEAEVRAFLTELDSTVASLTRLYGVREAA